MLENSVCLRYLIIVTGITDINRFEYKHLIDLAQNSTGGSRSAQVSSTIAY